MARINKKGQLSGSIGPVSHRIVNGETIVQTKPGKGRVQQTTATKTSATEFGIASMTAKYIRQGLSPILQNLAETQIHSWFAPEVYRATITDNPLPKGSRTLMDGNPYLLTGFQFNRNSPYSKYCMLEPEFKLNEAGQLSIALQEFHNQEGIIAVDGASDGEICYLLAAFDPGSWAVSYTGFFKFRVPLDDSSTEAQHWISPVLLPGQLVLITAAVFYLRRHPILDTISINSKQLHPCEIKAVFKS